VVRRDPMAMLPFCGYNMGDYWAHWLRMGQSASRPPRVFQVNWFRTDENGQFIWPGFGQNMRVLRWIRDVVNGNDAGKTRETPLGIMPTAAAIGASDLGLSEREADLLLSVDRDGWRKEVEDQEQFLAQFGDRLPAEIRQELEALKRRIG
jgi:phosphoenolpyruvate carboxykinase (GTP)